MGIHISDQEESALLEAEALERAGRAPRLANGRWLGAVIIYTAVVVTCAVLFPQTTMAAFGFVMAISLIAAVVIGLWRH